jgi:hypothetical protein
MATVQGEAVRMMVMVLVEAMVVVEAVELSFHRRRQPVFHMHSSDGIAKDAWWLPLQK